MESFKPIKLSKDVFEYKCIWSLENFKDLIAEGLLYEEWRSNAISIPGIPFKW